MKKNNSQQIAIVLNQEGGEQYVPEITARGSGEIAEQIIKLAKRYNIPVKRQKGLAQVLNALPEEQDIPAELFPALKIIIDEISAGKSVN